MKQNGRKGLSLPMEIIIGVVVLVVIALAVIMFTTGSITKVGGQTGAQRDQTACSILKENACIGQAAAAPVTIAGPSACGTAAVTYNCPVLPAV